MYENLKQYISNNINDNTSGSITPRKMRDVLNSIIESVGEDGQFIGVVTPQSTPPSTDGKCFAIAMTSGTYTNFDNISVSSNEVCVLSYNGSAWTKTNLVGGVNSRIDAANTAISQHTSAISGLSSRMELVGVSSPSISDDYIFDTKKEARKFVPVDERHLAHVLNYVYKASDEENHAIVELYIGTKPKIDDNFCDDNEWSLIKEENLV